MDHNDIYSIVERLRTLEEGLTPVNVKHGLNTQQKSVDQLSATFKPKTVAVLTAKKDPKNPMAGKLVGGCEESEELEEAVANEDVLGKVKKSFNDYLKSVVNDVKQDSDIKEKDKVDHDLGKKDTTDRDLVAKEVTVNSSPMIETDSAPVKTIPLDEFLVEIHGDEQNGFEIRHSGKAMKSKFKDLDHALMAVEMYAARRAQQKHADESADYIDEA